MSLTVTGKIVNIFKNYNDIVEKGEKLALFDQNPFLLKVKESQTAVDISNSILKQKKASLEKAKAELTNAKSNSLGSVAKIDDYKLYIVNLENPKSFESALKGAHIVIHIAHISFSEKVIKTGIKEGIEWFICIHTTGRYSKFKSASKRYIEIEDNLLANYNNLTILRPTMIYGDQKDRNMWKLINYLNKNKFFPI